MLAYSIDMVYKMNFLITFHRFGPYHHARLNALSTLCNLTAIEYTCVDNTYAWDIVPPAKSFEHITLFSDKDIDLKSRDEIKSKLWATLNKKSPDVIAIPGWSTLPALLTLEWAVKNNTPAIVMSASTESDETRKPWKEWIKTCIVKLFSAGIGGGSLHVDYLNKLGLPKNDLFIGYDTVDNEHFSRGSKKVKNDIKYYRESYSLPSNYFINSSRFVEKKNLFRLIDAYAKYKSTTDSLDFWHLVILGDGPLRNKLENHVANLGLNQFIHFPGFVQYPELPIYYGAANAYIQASTTEQWGLVVNEAMASGLPVLVSNKCGCAADLVIEGVNGFTFDPYETSCLTDLMLTITSNGCDIEQMGNSSRRIIDQWSTDVFAKNIMMAANNAAKKPPHSTSWLNNIILWILIMRGK
ncbi:glycosyltransferase [Methylomonas rapida]|uniref:Glycosyltransferase n=1 Tax=Methylomonas rapida TaxID=2963939 RepID=A0ABY7GLG7_9GAMM|nr:glycosyltransferase [Methylomonas rapida]WAR45342.1 glycosyltransferase [Methylomonas rapida]